MRMALSSSRMKSLFYNRIYNALQTEFSPEISGAPSYNPQATVEWQKLASAISEIAADIVSELQNSAEVKPGIGLTASGAAGAVSGETVEPGKIT